MLCRYSGIHQRLCLRLPYRIMGIAFSTGNSIPDYVPTEGYLAMIETVRE